MSEEEKRILVLSLQEPKCMKGDNIYVTLSREGTVAASKKEFNYHVVYPVCRDNDSQTGRKEMMSGKKANSDSVTMSDNYGVFLKDLIEANDCKVDNDPLVSEAVEAKDILKKIKELNK